MSLLADDFFRIEVCDFWKYWQRKKGLFSSLSKWWDVGKKKIQRIAIYYGSVKKREENTSRDLLNALATLATLAVVAAPSLPYSMKIGGEWCRIIHSNQQPVCLECNELGHTKKKIRCRVCKQLGHMSYNCDQQELMIRLSQHADSKILANKTNSGSHRTRTMCKENLLWLIVRKVESQFPDLMDCLPNLRVSRPQLNVLQLHFYYYYQKEWLGKHQLFQ